MEKSCLSRPSHPSLLLDPIINTITPPTPAPSSRPSSPPHPSYPLLFRLILLSPPPLPLSFVLLSSCSWSDYRADCTAAALQSCVSSLRGASLLLKLVVLFFNCAKSMCDFSFSKMFEFLLNYLPTASLCFPCQRRRVSMRKALKPPKTIAR